MIKIENAVVSYREDVALRGVSLSVGKGELVGIIGPNGAGKTTLLTLVNGLGKLLSGRVEVLGRPLNGGCPAALRRRIGYVPQLQNIDPRMPVSAREVVMMGRSGRLGLLRRPGPADHQAVDKLLQLVGMSHLAFRPVGHLSGGEQQRVAIARAFINRPPILLADEPTGNVDPSLGVGIVRLLEKINSTGTTVIVATHDKNIVDTFRKRVIALENGRIIRDQDKGVYGYE